MRCAVAGDTKLETPEGPLTVKTVGAAPTPVMVRNGDGLVRFAVARDVTLVATAQPVLRLTLDTGRALRVGADQLLLGPGGVARRAGDVQAGDALLAAFSFPAGYAYVTDSGDARVSDGCVRVTRVEDGGTADLYALRLDRPAHFVFSSGLIGEPAD